MAICEQEDHWLVLNTQLLVQTLQIFSEITFSVSSTQGDLKYLRMQYLLRRIRWTQDMMLIEFQLDWLRGLGFAPTTSKCKSIRKIMQYIKNDICTSLQDCIFKIALCSASFFVLPFQASVRYWKYLWERNISYLKHYSINNDKVPQAALECCCNTSK